MLQPVGLACVPSRVPGRRISALPTDQALRPVSRKVVQVLAEQEHRLGADALEREEFVGALADALRQHHQLAHVASQLGRRATRPAASVVARSPPRFRAGRLDCRLIVLQRLRRPASAIFSCASTDGRRSFRPCSASVASGLSTCVHVGRRARPGRCRRHRRFSATQVASPAARRAVACNSGKAPGRCPPCACVTDLASRCDCICA